MNDKLIQFLNLLRSLPLSKKVSLALVSALVIVGFALMFIWANQVTYQVLFNDLSPEDAGAIVTKLRERNISHKIEGNGTIVMVPSEKVHEMRLALAGDGLPKGGNVGFEIFDHTDFRTTKFVQELNYRRALQGELARTIDQFKQVSGSRVFIVLPRESLFIEESRPASASIQLDLSSNLPPAKLAAIVHLVSSAVEGLEPEQVTVVDTKGRVIFKGGNRADTTSLLLSDAQLDYTRKVENDIKKNVQSMLEGIVGIGKAIVRVNAAIDFNKTTLSEEEYDPFATAVRSKRDISEFTETSEGSVKPAASLINERRGVVPPETGGQRTRTKKDVATNYEINKITKTILKPAGSIQHLSVAAVIDGTYKSEKLPDGTVNKKYVPRTDEELIKFDDIVKKAMGFNEDREDQVSVSCMAFSGAISTDTMTQGGGKGFDIFRVLGSYRKIIVNLFLVALVFFLVVRPLVKGLRKMTSEGLSQTKELPPGSQEIPQLPETQGMSPKEKVLEVSKSNPEKTEQLLKGWISEPE